MIPRFVSQVRLFYPGALIAAAVASSATAQMQTDIVVEGRPVKSSEVQRTMRQITIGGNESQFPLARFRRPICPGVWGLRAKIAQPVVDRIMQNARTAAVAVNETPRCGANVWLIVTDKAAATFERLHDEKSFLTRHLTSEQVKRIRKQAGAARAWNIISDRNEEGQRIVTGGEHAAAWIAAKAEISAGEGLPANVVRSMSRLGTGMRMDIELSVVVIERSALDTLDTHALADYATMRMLANIEPPAHVSAVPTVLTLFSPGATETAPQRMTAFDRAYIQALYRSNPTGPASSALGDLAAQMAKAGGADD